MPCSTWGATTPCGRACGRIRFKDPSSMLIEITKLLDVSEKGTTIQFQTELGIGQGLWRNYNPQPQPGQAYHVEMDILDESAIGQNFMVVEVDNKTNDAYRLEWQNGEMIIQGEIDTVWDDRVVAMTVKAQRSSVSFLLNVPELAPYKDRFVRIHTKRISLSDCNIPPEMSVINSWSS